MVYSVYGTLSGTLDDIRWFFDVLTMLQMVEDDYLGSSGSRGSGRIEFRDLRLLTRTAQDYLRLQEIAWGANLADMQALSDDAFNRLMAQFSA
jgi:CRISPR-associated protein Csm3